MSDATVILTRCSDYGQAQISDSLARQFELLGGLEKFVSRGDSVLLKPNFIAPKSRRHPAQTHPNVIIETVKLLKDIGAKPFVADSPAWSNTFACVKALRLDEPLRKLGVGVKQLNRPRLCRIGPDRIRIGISSLALDADVIINLPKFKSHRQFIATFAVKNMFGCVAGKRKVLWHFSKGKNTYDFCKLLIEIYRFLKPAVTIIDGIIAMDGPGPIRGTPFSLGYLIGSTDPIASEALCAHLVNIEPDTLPILRTARQIGFGCSQFSQIEVIGDELPTEPRTDFQIPPLIPIRFSLAHVCKSIGKQIILLAKTPFSKSDTEES